MKIFVEPKAIAELERTEREIAVTDEKPTSWLTVCTRSRTKRQLSLKKRSAGP